MIESKWINAGGDISVPLGIRRSVFTDELGIRSEGDEKDAYAVHAVLYDDGEAVGTGRIYNDDALGFTVSHLCVLKKARKRRDGDLLARLLIWKTIQFSDTVALITTVAQVPFFARFGLRRTGDIFDVDGVPMIAMKADKDEVAFPSECGGGGHA